MTSEPAGGSTSAGVYWAKGSGSPNPLPTIEMNSEKIVVPGISYGSWAGTM